MKKIFPDGCINDCWRTMGDDMMYLLQYKLWERISETLGTNVAVEIEHDLWELEQ